MISAVGGIPSHLGYFFTLEFVRARLPKLFQSPSNAGIATHNTRLTSLDVYTYFIAGGVAGFVSQTITTPFDIITQRQMVQEGSIFFSLLQITLWISMQHNIQGIQILGMQYNLFGSLKDSEDFTGLNI